MSRNGSLMKGVYRIRCLATGDCYIGSSKNIELRWSQHRMGLERGCWEGGSDSHFQRAWSKYGKESFDFEVLEVVSGSTSSRELSCIETRYLQENWPTGYNVNQVGGQPPGFLGRVHSESSKDLISKAWTLGRREQLRDFNSTRTRTSEERERVGRAVRAFKSTGVPDETREKISQSKRGKSRSEECKKKIAESLQKYYRSR